MERSSQQHSGFLNLAATILTGLYVVVISGAEIYIVSQIWDTPLTVQKISMFVVVPLATIALLIYSFFSTPYFREMTVACLSSVFVAMYGAQIYIYFVQNESVFVSKNYTAIIDLRAKGVDVYPVAFHAETTSKEIGYPDKFILSGRPNTISLLCNKPPYTIVFTTDRYGFNNPDGIWDAPKLDIVALGDSFTSGACVPHEHQLVTRIRDSVPLTLNLGSLGTGPLQQLANFREFGEQYKPKSIVWFYNEGNDLFNLVDEVSEPILMSYMDPEFQQDGKGNVALFDQKLADYADEMLSERTVFNKSFKEIIKDNLLLRALREKYRLEFRRTYNRLDKETDVNQYIPRLKSVASLVKNTAASWGGEIVFVYLPTKGRWLPNFKDLTYRSDVLKAFDEVGVPVVDMVPHFATAEDPATQYYLHNDAHYSIEGYGRVAEETLKFLRSKH